ncbi:uncharacterized protein LOC129833841 isoform X4 [Salvelinus fontinalis]|uniref:uncharacterized protein LOC129833841 isoform X4 n=1 Tax=Salvelinus fontinalis TaxID=8038 RepID=UPI00248577E6|nr:uncharacterized protein LOC129833841 isoform X4 [Salvelinus fontinalis]
MLNTNCAEFWSDPYSSSSSEEEALDSHYRTTHLTRTKQQQQQQQERLQQQQERLHYLEKWTWEDDLDGKGHWAEPGEYRRPKEELEAAKAERRYYEALARQSGWRPERQPQKCLWGGTGSVAESGVRPEPTPPAYRKEPVRAELEML